MAINIQQIQQWIAQDPDIETQQELKQLLEKSESGDTSAQDELEQRFNGRLEFGTGGIRGPLQAGPMGINRVLVSQTAAGLATYLNVHDKEPSVVIAYDGRKNSAIFAKDTAEIMAGAGIKTLLLPYALPTPVLAYAIQYFNTSAGVMVTASHNPPQDNGYKVYLGKDYGGSQITSPIDQEIAKCIEHAAEQNIQNYPRANNYTITNEQVIEQYAIQTAKLATATIHSLNYVYTAMHGVGKDTLIKTLQAAKLPLPHLVAEQAEPNPLFPTVSFPNPEEKGALDLAIKLAKEQQAELILANDPDADRLAVTIPNAEGQWQTLHGNMIGCLLAWHFAKQAKLINKTGTLACSLVSTPALKHIAQRYQLPYVETLTGFKYIAKVPNLLFGFEESIGYLVDPDKVKDKDGISAAIAFLNLVNHLKTQGKTLNQYIEEFTQEFGAYASGQISIRVEQLADIKKLMAGFRTNPPHTIGQHEVVEYQDYMQHNEPNDILVYRLNNQGRMIIRPSGTEPKVKVYLDIQGNDNQHATLLLKQFEQDVQDYLKR